MSTKKERKSKIIEVVLLSFFGVIWVTGLVFGILGLCAYNIDPVTKNPIYIAQKAFGQMIGLGLVDFRIFGCILLLISMIGIIIVLYHYANKYDTVKITKARRELMMKELLEKNAFSINKGNEVIKPNLDQEQIPGDTETTAKIS